MIQTLGIQHLCDDANNIDLSNFQELVARLQELEKQNKELKEHLSSIEQPSAQPVNKKAKKNNEQKLKKKKPFDFSRYMTSTILGYSNVDSRAVYIHAK